MRTQLQQNELDKIESKILVKLFGSVVIPSNTAIFLNSLGINPNRYIEMFESKITPVMNSDGTIPGKNLKALLSFTRFNSLLNIIDIPETDFLLSDMTNTIVAKFFPNIEVNYDCKKL